MTWYFFILTYWKQSFVIFIVVRCIKPSLNIIRNIFKKIFGFNMNNKAIRICIAQFCLVSILWSNIVHTKAIQNPYISVLLISNIDIPKYNGLIIFTNVFFISIAIKWSENFSCQFFMPMIITQQTFVLMKTS